MKKQGIVKRLFKGLLNSKQGNQANKEIQVLQYRPKEEQDWTQAEAQIINHLINMDSIMRITKQLDYYHQYITLEKINQVLCQQNIDISQTKKALLGGLIIDDCTNDRKYITKNLPYQYYSLRSLLWKINLQYFDCQVKRKWVSSVERKLLEYWRMIDQFIVVPVQKKIGIKQIIRKKSAQDTAEVQKKDHPLNFSTESKWQNYFKDLQLWKQIQKDTKRTRKNCTFFSQPYTMDISRIQTSLNPNQITFMYENNLELTYSDCLTRIIFVYLKKHSQEVYYQGMNEFAALVFYCFTNKNSQYFRRVSESDAYFVFEKLMSFLPKKHFQKGIDYVKKLSSILLKIDLRLYEELQKQGGAQTLELVTMRWFMTGFLNQFGIDECLQLWDVIIGWPDPETPIFDKFMYMAVAMVHLHRQRIMEGQNIAGMLSKIEISPVELGEKSLSLFKIFPKLVGQ